MDDYCGSPFWDWNVSWYSEDPDFTPCFQETVLVWTPCAFLLALTPVHVWYLAAASGFRSRVPLSWLTWLKICLSMAILGLHLLSMGFDRHYSPGIFPPYLVNAAILVFTYVSYVVLLILQKRQGWHTSAVHFLFWSFTLVCTIITFRHEVKNYIAGHSSVLLLVIESSHLATAFFQFLAHCWADLPSSSHVPIHDSDHPVCPEITAGFVSRLLFSWCTKMAILGHKRPLLNEDIWEVRPEDRCAPLVKKYLKRWKRSDEEPVVKKDKKTVFQNILAPLWATTWPSYVAAQLFKLFVELLAFVSPQLMGLLITYVDDKEEETWKGYLYATLVLISALAQTLILNRYYFCMWKVYMNVQSSLNPIIYSKVLKLSNGARKGTTSGEIMNLFSVDTDKIRDLVYYVDTLWSAPLQISLALYFLWAQLGVAVLAGLAAIILLIPVNGVITSKMEKLQAAQMRKKDERVKTMNEVLSGMKIIKLYAWEPSFQQKVASIRCDEVVLLKKGAYLNSLAEFLWNVCPFLVSLAAFGTYVLMDENNVLDAKKAFVSLSLFNLLNEPIGMVPTLITKWVQAAVSFRRVNDFLNCDELDPSAVNHVMNSMSDEESPPAIIMKNGTFTWGGEQETQANGHSKTNDKNEDESSKEASGSSDSTPFCLENINLTVKKGSLVAVVGSVGVGKSSLLSAILGEMEKKSGSVELHGSVAYVPQVAWVRNATLKENIIFNEAPDERRYRRILLDCALLSDLQTLPAGDRTEIGEKGINLSGGQKQRVSLARAAYSDADTILLDDPLSAVDAHVAEHIFNRLIGPTGYLASKTRLLVTHSLTYLPHVDLIYVIKDGKIIQQGTYNELLNSQIKGGFGELLNQYRNEASKSLEVTSEEKDKVHSESESWVPPAIAGVRKRGLSQSSVHSISSLRGHGATPLSLEDDEFDGKSVAIGEKLMEEETVKTGNVTFAVYWAYVKAVGFLFALLIFVSYAIAQGFAVGTNMWLSVWSSVASANSTGTVESSGPLGLGRNGYLAVYCILGICQSIAFLIGVLFLNIGCLGASKLLHNKMLARILRAPMLFFETTPVGRILNRFGEDVELMDSNLPWEWVELVSYFFKEVGIFAVICISTPIFVVAIIPTSICYYFLQRFYVATTRQISRIQSTLRSPIYSHFGETINGAPSIRAYRLQRDFSLELERRVDSMQSASFCLFSMRRWLSVRLESMGGCLVFLAALFGVMARKTLSSSVIGLSITYAMDITYSLSWLTKVTSYLESDIICVERTLQYANETAQEDDFEKDVKPNPEWPQEGNIEFDHYDLRYRPGLELALKDITCRIQGGTKVGIVGRTGAGKSSMTLALFRIVEAAGGSISVDGIDISEVGLHDVRRRITIIPQDPVLFSASMRDNLDPFGQYNDNEIWRALELSHLKSYVLGLSGGLSHEVSEGGENLSVGQRQLVCLARAILRKTNVLVLDEATAAIDLETDVLIQKTIRSEFAHCTVLTIAHRLNTIMDSDKVMVLEKGEIKEFDSPEKLLENSKSLFYGMAKEAGVLQS